MPDHVAKEITTFYLDYNAEMRRFWEDKRQINYSLVLQPYLNVDHSISGISFGNGFIGKYNKPDSLARGERMAVIAHEIGHYYLSDVAAFEGDTYIGQWFNEGFNDYLTYFNLVAAGKISPEEFETIFNEIFRHLYTSPIKNTPNDKIFENFWLLGDYSKLPYWRGCLFALYLDNQISLKSNNARSIRDLMLDLKEIARTKSKKEFTNEELIKAVSKYLPENVFRKEFSADIINGSPIAFDNAVLLPFFQIQMKGETPVLTIADEKQFLAHFEFK
jgi:hypothetical protein